jgi:hypothetical protein
MLPPTAMKAAGWATGRNMTNFGTCEGEEGVNLGNSTLDDRAREINFQGWV